jgi:catechol 2,3-dioxygenase-like lactoylglutathione lyase family enzyme
MVYLSMSVRSTADAIAFYCDGLGVFRAMAGTGRLLCTNAEHLIVDVYEWGTDRHAQVLGTDKPCPISFWIHADPFDFRTFCERLDSLGVQYWQSFNKAGARVDFQDPFGNRFGVAGPGLPVD